MFIRILELFPAEKYSSMNESDLTINKYNNEETVVFILTNAPCVRSWPRLIETAKGTYQFVANEAMPNWASGNYLGYAKYHKI